MSQPPANRMQLLKTKQQRKLAQKGFELLKKKRDALIREYVGYVQEYKKQNQQLIKDLTTSYNTLHKAQAVSGVHRVKSLGFSTKPSIQVNKKEKNIMGVRVDTLDIHTVTPETNASLIGTSYYVTQAQEQFQHTIPALIRLAELEKIILALAEEIKKTKRRVNALEHIHLPRIQKTQKHIQDRLAEIEREEFTRLKHLKEHGS